MMNVNEQFYIEVKRKWNSIYPIYFDSSKTLAEGRKLPKEQCIDTPTLEEIIKAVTLCQLRHIIQPHKAFSRDYFQMGRLKVELFKENGEPQKVNIKTRKEMIRKIGEYLKQIRNK